MSRFWKRKPALGVGLGVGLIGTLAVALRFRMQKASRVPLPETISPAIFATRVIQTSGGEIVYHTSGAGDPLIFLHGIYPGASSFEWSRVYPEFTVGNEVIAPDLIGFGESERPQPGLDADQHVQAMADFVHAICRGRRPVIVAAGYGAAIAIKLAAMHPDLVRRLILFAPAGLGAGIHRLPLWLRGMSRVQGLNVFVYKNYFARKPFIRHWLTQIGFSHPEKLTDELVDMLATCAAQYGTEHAMLALIRGRNLFGVRHYLSRLVPPLVVLCPNVCERIVPNFVERIREAVPQARIVPVGELGTLGALEDPRRLRLLIEEALSPSIPASAA